MAKQRFGSNPAEASEHHRRENGVKPPRGMTGHSFLKVIITPRAKGSVLVGFQGEDLKIKIAAPPVDGAANEALVKFLAKLLGLRPGDLSLTAGQTGRRKIVRIEGLGEDELWSRLNTHL